jgi:hypothetical protein
LFGQQKYCKASTVDIMVTNTKTGPLLWLLTTRFNKREITHPLMCKNCFKTLFQNIEVLMCLWISDCIHDIDEQSYLPSNVIDMVQCEMPQGCGGLDCCLDLSFQIPLGVDTVTYNNMSFWYRMDSCNFTIEVGFRTFTWGFFKIRSK